MLLLIPELTSCVWGQRTAIGHREEGYQREDGDNLEVRSVDGYE